MKIVFNEFVAMEIENGVSTIASVCVCPSTDILGVAFFGAAKHGAATKHQHQQHTTPTTPTPTKANKNTIQPIQYTHFDIILPPCLETIDGGGKVDC